MALTKAMAEKAGEAAWCIHLGATSNDIVDSAVALQIKFYQVTKTESEDFARNVMRFSRKKRDTVMLGRTHGQAAVPITFGLKIAVFTDEFRRHLVRLDELESRQSQENSGAVGTGAAQGDNAKELQQLILQHLGLTVPVATTR